MTLSKPFKDLKLFREPEEAANWTPSEAECVALRAIEGGLLNDMRMQYLRADFESEDERLAIAEIGRRIEDVCGTYFDVSSLRSAARSEHTPFADAIFSRLIFPEGEL